MLGSAVVGKKGDSSKEWHHRRTAEQSQPRAKRPSSPTARVQSVGEKKCHVQTATKSQNMGLHTSTE